MYILFFYVYIQIQQYCYYVFLGTSFGTRGVFIFLRFFFFCFTFFLFFFFVRCHRFCFSIVANSLMSRYTTNTDSSIRPYYSTSGFSVDGRRRTSNRRNPIFRARSIVRAPPARTAPPRVLPPRCPWTIALRPSPVPAWFFVLSLFLFLLGLLYGVPLRSAVYSIPCKFNCIRRHNSYGFARPLNVPSAITSGNANFRQKNYLMTPDTYTTYTLRFDFENLTTNGLT